MYAVKIFPLNVQWGMIVGSRTSLVIAPVRTRIHWNTCIYG